MELSTIETRQIPGFCVDSDSYNHIPLKFVIKTSRRPTNLVAWQILIFKKSSNQISLENFRQRN